MVQKRATDAVALAQNSEVEEVHNVFLDCCRDVYGMAIPSVEVTERPLLETASLGFGWVAATSMGLDHR